MRVENESVGDDLLLLLLLLQNQVSIMACLAVCGPVCCPQLFPRAHAPPPA